MHGEWNLLRDLVIVFTLALGVLFICHRLRLSTIVGFLLTGLLVGPSGLRILASTEQVEALAEIGVALLLFTIGAEFSLKRLMRIRRLVLVGGTLQVALTTLVVTLATWPFASSYHAAMLNGFLVSLSSTAIVLRLLNERAEIDAPQGRIAVGALIFQDLVAVPMMMLIPLLDVQAGGGSFSLPLFALKGLALAVGAVAAARWIVPWFLHRVAVTRSNELFLLAAIALCFGVALLSVEAGLSIALGAFLAGLILSESEYSHHALGSILPFRDVFMSLFFISIGMLLDLGVVFDHLGLALALAAAVVAGKALIASGTALVLAYPLRVAALSGLALAQVGEFSFVLAKTGVDHGILPVNHYQLFLAVSILTMLVAPSVVSLSPRVADWLLGRPALRRFARHASGIATEETLRDHLVVVGYGANGRHLVEAAKAFRIPYVILDMNPDTVRGERANGEPILYGDATYAAVLEQARMKEARLCAIAISDPDATRRAVQQVRQCNPQIGIIARARFVTEAPVLLKLGADHVISQEYEAAIAVFTRVLERYQVPRNAVDVFVTKAHADGYSAFRRAADEFDGFGSLRRALGGMETARIAVGKGSPADGRTLAELDLRRRFKATVLAVEQNGQYTANPSGEQRLQSGDAVVALYDPSRYDKLAEMFKEAERGSDSKDTFPQISG
ncbi:MAG: potassium transporter KefB [Myxococcales bacterium]|nr:MAG: potassium transporter KefB [Myxococcales bacterium]